MLGNFLIHDDTPSQSDAVVVLNTGTGYYSRLIEAADLYNKGFAKNIIINGNRKMEIDRMLEEKGFVPCCSWYEDRLRVLSLYNVPRNKIITINAEDVYDSISEAQKIGNHINKMNINKIIITTSKYHTKRAHFIWTMFYKDDLQIKTIAAKTDPYNPDAWWKEGRQVRWVLAEYGAWIYYYLQKIKHR